MNLPVEINIKINFSFKDMTPVEILKSVNDLILNSMKQLNWCLLRGFVIELSYENYSILQLPLPIKQIISYYPSILEYISYNNIAMCHGIGFRFSLEII